jgi:hypothetical protein
MVFDDPDALIDHWRPCALAFLLLHLAEGITILLLDGDGGSRRCHPFPSGTTWISLNDLHCSGPEDRASSAALRRAN